MARKTGKAKKSLGRLDLATDTVARGRLDKITHIYHGGARCETETRGYPNPENHSPLELVLEASNGFVPLWGHRRHAQLAFSRAVAVGLSRPRGGQVLHSRSTRPGSARVRQRGFGALLGNPRPMGLRDRRLSPG